MAARWLGTEKRGKEKKDTEDDGRGSRGEACEEEEDLGEDKRVR